MLVPSSTKTIKYRDCGSQEGEIVGMDISPCDSEPCVLKRGTSVDGSLTFIPHEDLKRAKLSAHAIIDKLPLPLPIPSDACQGYGLSCPVDSGVKSMFKIHQAIESEFPVGNLTLKAAVTDSDTSQVVFCFEVDLEIA
ncbi:predicted protein [Nematostella vectensis]|uniref:Niemann-Pick type C2 sterol transporter 3 n=1 Tax=Nematostella vectensis TaxID=45351 RepID=A7RYC7_NEMVE|nr:predicted protein [Nematostella vectensis]UXP71148.1 Niemann-Pick type C2 sterol transporter 3 [Nematostella vectensis]|eukprot:XP_001635502.1 predicted protein [Nematostella vectensis]